MQISYILPFYKKYELFKRVLPVNDWLQQEDVEVVCVLDDPCEEHQMMDLVRSTPQIKFSVIVNDWEHAWRPPCIAYNVGIRHSLANHVVLADPESIVCLPDRKFLHTLIYQEFRSCFAGICWMEDDFRFEDSPDVLRHKVQVCEAIRKVWQWGNGFLLAPKIALERIYGFDEGRISYGFDDTDIRVRLARLGNRCIIDGRIRVFHWNHGGNSRTVSDEFPGPNVCLSWQSEFWGTAFNRVAYDWNKP